MQFQIGRVKVALGHVSFGSNRFLIDSFSSRGITVGIPVNKRLDFSLTVLNGTSIVGWNNFSLVIDFHPRSRAGTNHRDYPNEIFAPAANLSSCGGQGPSPRTWVDIFDQADRRFYGFCALNSSDDLANLWFGVPQGQSPPPRV
jgi:hypothetical protein